MCVLVIYFILLYFIPHIYVFIAGGCLHQSPMLLEPGVTEKNLDLYPNLDLLLNKYSLLSGITDDFNFLLNPFFYCLDFVQQI